jgi:hypothetical protein
LENGVWYLGHDPCAVAGFGVRINRTAMCEVSHCCQCVTQNAERPVTAYINDKAGATGIVFEIGVVKRFTRSQCWHDIHRGNPFARYTKKKPIKGTSVDESGVPFSESIS